MNRAHRSTSKDLFEQIHSPAQGLPIPGSKDSKNDEA